MKNRYEFRAFINLEGIHVMVKVVRLNTYNGDISGKGLYFDHLVDFDEKNIISIMQYTMHDDRKCKNIYDADYVEDIFGNIFLVSWNQSMALFTCYPMYKKTVYNEVVLYSLSDTTIIGNKWENTDMVWNK